MVKVANEVRDWLLGGVDCNNANESVCELFLTRRLVKWTSRIVVYKNSNMTLETTINAFRLCVHHNKCKVFIGMRVADPKTASSNYY